MAIIYRSLILLALISLLATGCTSTPEKNISPSPPPATQNKVSLTTLTWRAAGATVTYPESWKVLTWGNADLHVSERIELVSGQTPNTPSDYFCIDLQINPLPSSDSYLTNGSTVTTTPNRLQVYQEDLRSTGKEQLSAWLTNRTRNNHFTLANGRTLSVQMIYGV